jgi:hypothetical protein
VEGARERARLEREHARLTARLAGLEVLLEAQREAYARLREILREVDDAK